MNHFIWLWMKGRKCENKCVSKKKERKNNRGKNESKEQGDPTKGRGEGIPRITMQNILGKQLYIRVWW